MTADAPRPSTFWLKALEGVPGTCKRKVSRTTWHEWRPSEIDRIKRALRPLVGRRSVRGMSFETGTDAGGGRAVYVRVIVTDSAPNSATWPDTRVRLRDEIRDTVAAHGIERWVYISFRTESEEMAEAGR